MAKQMQRSDRNAGLSTSLYILSMLFIVCATQDSGTTLSRLGHQCVILWKSNGLLMSIWILLSPNDLHESWCAGTDCNGHGHKKEGSSTCTCNNPLPQRGSFGYGGTKCDMRKFSPACLIPQRCARQAWHLSSRDPPSNLSKSGVLKP
jgi:hypothetical protein